MRDGGSRSALRNNCANSFFKFKLKVLNYYFKDSQHKSSNNHIKRNREL